MGGFWGECVAKKTLHLSKGSWEKLNMYNQEDINLE